MDYLIEKGCNIDAKEREGVTLFYHCCETGDLTRVNYLISKDADLQCDNNTFNSLCVNKIENK
jgi:ankyrin repeat protein